jgi:hypothetical protein
MKTTRSVKFEALKFLALFIPILPLLGFLPQSALADMYQNKQTLQCMNVQGPDRYGNYINRKISQYTCTPGDPEQTFNSDPDRDTYKLLRFGKNKSLCWNTSTGIKAGEFPFLYPCKWGDFGQMIDYEIKANPNDNQRLQMAGKGLCIEAGLEARYAGYGPIFLAPCSDSWAQKWIRIR